MQDLRQAVLLPDDGGLGVQADGAHGQGRQAAVVLLVGMPPEVGSGKGKEMSILIKMEMPSGCRDCGFNYDSECTLLLDGLDETDGENRRPNCPLIEVPKHGRLIEDTALDNMSMWNTNREYDRGWDSAVQAAKNRIKTAPTIIKAEGEDG